MCKEVSAGTQAPQHLVVKYDVLVLFFKFYHKVLRKAVKIVKKSLKVPKVLLVKCAAGVDWVPRCRAGARVLGASTFPLEKTEYD
jgi:hypothetical protein